MNKIRYINFHKNLFHVPYPHTVICALGSNVWKKHLRTPLMQTNHIIIRWIFFFLFTGRGSTTWMACSCVALACERRRISGCHLAPPKNNVCEAEPGNDFFDVMTFVSPWPIRFHDRMKLECSSQRIPRAVVLGLFELNCDWLRIATSQKSSSGSGSQTLFFGRTKWQPQIRLRSQASVAPSICVLLQIIFSSVA